MNFRLLALSLCAGVLAACTATPVSPPKPAQSQVSQAESEAMHAAVVAAGKQQARELAVVPLRDPHVEDLRAQAATALAARDLSAAANALNEALLIVADDPAVLQERAEVALLAADLPRAETLALRAVELGSAAGPLCRRHWEALYQIRDYRRRSLPVAASLDASAARDAKLAELSALVEAAKAQREACTVVGFERM